MLKPMMLGDKTTYVSMDDPSIDWNKTAEDYLKDRSDEVLGKLRKDASNKSPEVAKLMTGFVTRAQAGDMAAQIQAVKWILAELLYSDPGKSVETYRVKDGEKLTKFEIGVIPPSEMARIIDECKGKDEEGYFRAFLSGIRDIQNFADDLPKKKVDGVEYVDPFWLRVRFTRSNRDIAGEVGRMVWRWNQMGDADAKN